MSLEPDDLAVARRVRRLINRYEDATTPPAQPLAKAILDEIGYDSELLGHEVAIGYLEHVCRLPRQVVAWVVGSSMAVEHLYRVQERLLAAELPSGPGAEARERERLRAEARDGTCPTCGACGPSRADRLLDSYARSVVRLTAMLDASEKGA